MKITDEEIAETLDKTLEEVLEIKTENPAVYEVLMYGMLCRRLSLTEEDLEKYHRKLEKEEEK